MRAKKAIKNLLKNQGLKPKKIVYRKYATNSELTKALTEKIEMPKLPFYKRLFEWLRLTKEIYKKLEVLRDKETEYRHAGLLDYKRSGIPVLKLQLEYLKKKRKSL